MHSYDVVIIGAGHNGLTCAAYLGMAGLKVKVLERRSVVGGAAVTEEFHPGFRNSVAAYTVSLLNPKVIARSSARPARIADRRAPRAEFPARRTGRISSRPKAGPSARSRSSAARCRPIRRFNRQLDAGADVLARARLAGAAQPHARLTLRAMGELLKAGRLGNRLRRLSRRSACALRSVHQIGRRLSRRLVRGRPRQGPARLRRRRRQLRQPLYARHRLRSAASRVRRGERQEAHLGHAIGGMGAITQAMAPPPPAHGVEIETDAAGAGGRDREGQGVPASCSRMDG